MQRTGPKEPPKGSHRIAKLLARAGVASRREIERMIEERRVALNGVPLETPATILTSLDGVTVDGVAVQAAEASRLFVFHKPSGFLTAANDPAGRKTIYDCLPKDLPRLMPVGRLDLSTEGLLLMTTDGEFKRQLELPSTGVERAYRARAYGEIGQARLEELIHGVEIEGVRYGSINANFERRTGANVWIEMILTEGKNREVRRVLEYLGLRVSRLIRTRYGPFILGDLPAGEIGEVRQNDLVAFRQSLKLPTATAVNKAREMPITVSRARATGKTPLPARERLGVGASAASSPDRPTSNPSLIQGGEKKRRTPAPRKHEIREEIGTRPLRERPQRTAPGARPVAATDQKRQRPVAPSAPRPEAEPREAITTRPKRAQPGPLTAHAPKPKPKRGAGWAKAKPKPGARPGKPRRPRP